MNTVKTEPVATLGAAAWALVMAGVALLPTFGVDVTLDQQGAIGAFMTALIAFITVWQRSQVVPVSNAVSKDQANAAIKDAFESEPGIGKPPLIQ